jgi:uncharacterized protein (DUF2141 family)
MKLERFIILLLLISISTSFTIKNNNNIVVKVGNLVHTNSPVFLALYNNEKDFRNPNKAVLTKIILASDLKKDVLLEKIPEGYYALTIFQDLNGNKKIDYNFFGYPTEPFGFSNNPVLKFGPPSFKECSFYFSGNKSQEITVNLK